MKVMKAFVWFLSIAMFASLTGVAPVSAPKTVAPFLQVGPKAELTDTTANASPNYTLAACQLAGPLNPGYTCYDPYQIRRAYGIDTLINAGYTGKGKTIIIVDAFQSPNIVNQLNYFDSFYGLPSLNGLGGKPDRKLGTFTQIAPDGLTPFDTTNDDMLGWAEEISLDVLWAHAIAPGANIVLDLSKSDQDPDILSATQYVIDRHMGDVISQSFGENESCVDAAVLKEEHKVFAKATMNHMTLLASTGDDGAGQLTCDGNSYVQAASSPSSDPLVTGVGGTELHAASFCLTADGCDPTVNPAPGTYQGEIAWNEILRGSNIGSGGGLSVLYKSPFFQSLAARTGKQRGLPDVSYNAAVLHGVLTYLDIPGDATGMYTFGGTSAGSPQWAAIVAIADQKAGRSLGFINAALYLYSLSPQKYANIFHDITSGNNTMVEVDNDGNPYTVQGYNAGKGWDAVTGLGSPKVTQLVDFLSRFTTDQDGKQAVNNTDPNNNNHFGGGHRMSH
ncbi:MAG: S53 family peptidase [Anaerolineaceae bacterium]|nr:S53 family peptidase [Anaerolineaceae bacterium]